MCNFENFIELLSGLSGSFPHGSNIHTKIVRNLTDKQKLAFQIIEPKYSSIVAHSRQDVDDLTLWIDEHCGMVNDYIELINQPQCGVFSHQSDFKSSVIPEFICNLFSQVVKVDGFKLIVEAQKDVIIDFVFSHQNQGSIFPKNKRVDSAVLLPSSLVFNNGAIERFSIPVICVEVKTNLDKNMITGIEHSVEKLKSTFPLCKYFVISEYSDFAIDSQNYAGTYIDEIYILRKQKRSDFRRNGVANHIDSQLIKEFASIVVNTASSIQRNTYTVQQNYTSGTLIGR